MSKFKITLTTKNTFKSETVYVEAKDKETADCFAEEQADAYGCSFFVQNAWDNEIPKDSEIVYLT